MLVKSIDKSQQEAMPVRDDFRSELELIFFRLLDRFGPQGWWPAETEFEVVIGAILTQNTAWSNVERAIDALKKAQVLSIDGIYQCDEENLAELIKPSGFFRQKARRIKHFVHYIMEEWGGSLDAFLNQPVDLLRSQLLELNGIGPETADSIILYAAKKPSFVVDRYTHRIMFRHGYVPERYHYESLRQFFMGALPHDVYMFQEYHALFVRLGKEYCGSNPTCEGCPLEKWAYRTIIQKGASL
ncbi:MAG: endonuclease III domain-containing protein [Thermodesulforhabdaceae bacterium]